jgi:hypothetical protein
LQTHWNPRNPDPYTDDELADIVREFIREFESAVWHPENETEACRSFRAAQKNAARTRLAALRKQRQDEEQAAAERAANAEHVKAVASQLGVGERQAQRLLKSGTTVAAQAEALAKITGEDVEQFLRKPGKRGKNPNLVAHLMRPYADGASWRDFIDDTPLVDDATFTLVAAFIDAYKRRGFPDHVRELEPVFAFARSNGIGADTAQTLWDAYKRWRIPHIAELALAEIEDPDDFG